MKKRDGNTGRRVINDSEAQVVCQIYQWLVNEGISTTGITKRLNSMRIPTKRGGYWTKQVVLAILTNKSYTGRTLAFTMIRGKAKYSKPKEDWIEIPGVTPVIIDAATFEAAQRQLQLNREKTVTTTKHDYLLRGHIRCRQCGRAYTGGIHTKIVNGKRYAKYRYRCMGKVRAYAPFTRCNNRNWMADKLEAMVWAELEAYLSDHDLIKNELEKQCQDVKQLSVYESELKEIDRQLRTVDRQQRQLLHSAVIGEWEPDQLEAENRRINKAKDTLKAQKADLETQLKASRAAVVNAPKLEGFIRDIQDKLPNLDFEGKRLALDMLGITVWLDGDNVEVSGTIDPEMLDVTQTMQVY